MSVPFDIVVSRLRNMLTRISAADSGFEDLCTRHAELTAGIRSLNAMEDPAAAQRDGELRRRRSQLEQEMFAIMQANTRV
ncbi:MAG: hypothetical protein RLN99_12640 [Kiloniellaceae bacterium]